MSPQAGWILKEEVAPRLRNSIPRTTSFVGCEDHEELVQDGIAIAAHLMHNAELAGKQVTPGNIAYYAAQHIRSGRRSTGSSRVDIMGTQTQLSGRARLHSLNEVVADKEDASEIIELQDLLSLDAEDPSMIAARNLDWQAMMSMLTEREQAIVVALIEGGTVSDVAMALKLSRSTLQTAKNRLAALVLEFLGVDILIEVLRLPGWKDGINAHREMMACRHDRRN